MSTIDFKEVQRFKIWWAWLGVDSTECAVYVCHCAAGIFWVNHLGLSLHQILC